MYKQLSRKQLVIAEMVLIYTKEHLQYKETKGHYEKVTETIKIMSRYAARNILSQLHRADMSRIEGEWN